MSTHRNLLSSGRWYGKRVGKAIASGDEGTASFEWMHFKRLTSLCSPIERSDVQDEFDRARRDTIVSFIKEKKLTGSP
jgi:hypothetical protein